MTLDSTVTIASAISAYVADLPRQRGRRGRKSAKTTATYSSGLRAFARMLRQADRNPDAESASALATADVVDFARFIADNGWTGATTNVYLTAATRFYRWLLRQKVAGFAAADLTELEDELREDWRSSEGPQPPHLPDEADVQAALRTARETETPTQAALLLALRNAAVQETLRSTCARIAEVAGLLREDYDAAAGSAQVVGKGRKVRTVYLDSRATRAIAAYLCARDSASLALACEAEPLFARHDRRASGKLLPVSSNALRTGLYGICARAGVEDIHPHWWRHRGATLIQRETHDLAMVQKVLGHESAATTAAIYLHLDDADVRAALANVEM